jgi:transposase
MRAAKFADMREQLLNTIRLQHATYKLSLLKTGRDSDPERVRLLSEAIEGLRRTRRCGPPRLVMRGHRLELQIPFLPPMREMVDENLGPREYTKRAGADRGLRENVAVSVEDGVDELISCSELMRKRELLKHQTRALSSQVRRKHNNWDRKRQGVTAPASVLKRERHLSSLWAKVRRLDREIARQVSSRLVWFCEDNSVRTLYMEDLKGYQAPAGNRTLSWNMSTNLWSKVLDTTKYMRQTLGHPHGGIWTVNPAWTSRRCHVCGERGIRVESADSTTEVRGGEYFYCPSCDTHIHADINAARNLSQSSAVSGRTQLVCPTLSNLQ